MCCPAINRNGTMCVMLQGDAEFLSAKPEGCSLN
jgi:hypothetical protein